MLHDLTYAEKNRASTARIREHWTPQNTPAPTAGAMSGQVQLGTVPRMPTVK